jgi:hypothetical protein
MYIPIPTLNLPLSFSFNRQSKENDKPTAPANETPAAQHDSDSQMGYAIVDPTLLLMLIAIVLLSSAVVVYAARH